MHPSEMVSYDVFQQVAHAGPKTGDVAEEDWIPVGNVCDCSHAERLGQADRNRLWTSRIRVWGDGSRCTQTPVIYTGDELKGDK